MGRHRSLSRALSWRGYTPMTTKRQPAWSAHHAIGMKFRPPAPRSPHYATEIPLSRPAVQAYGVEMKVSVIHAAARAIGSPVAAA